MIEADPPSMDVGDRREQPFFYSWNRRVRHLHGISLRNLNITPPGLRARGRTITDDDYNLKTPAKALAVTERNHLHTSRSFSDLPKPDRSRPSFDIRKGQTQHDKPTTVKNRPNGQLRRRSTLQWGGASPRSRQQKLEDLAIDRLVDTWFSLHTADYDEPVYVSEVMQHSMNPSFSFFDLDADVTSVTRSDSLELKVWCKNSQMDGYRLLVDLHVNLRSLQFIGKSLENFHHPLPQNCVLFHLSDGTYTSFTDLPAETIYEPQLKHTQKTSNLTNSSTYDALMKLANLDDCIQDALQTRQQLEADINLLLAAHRQTTASNSNEEAQQERSKTIQAALTAERKKLQQMKQMKRDREASLEKRKLAMEEAILAGRDAASFPKLCRKKAHAIQSDLDKVEETSRAQLRRVCECILSIFPIEPVKNRTLQFTIRGIHLPNSVFDDTNRDEIAAALGFTAQLVYQLALYLSAPLPYTIEPNASSSFITDGISLSLAQRRYPLHPTNVNYKFEYGVFLLNKNIEFLMNRAGLRVLDIRHTLPNIKYLLYMLTAGKGELPARKVGGIRGLLGGIASPNLSRRSSDDSAYSRQSNTEPANGGLAGATIREEEKNTEAHDSFPGPGRVKGLPYRRSLLREAG